MRVVAAGAIEAGITAVQNGDGAKAIDGCELLGAGGARSQETHMQRLDLYPRLRAVLVQMGWRF